MSLELAVVMAGLVLLVITARSMTRGGMVSGPPTVAVQFGLGLLCGAIGAVLAAVPFTDAVPDRWEGPMLAILGASIIVTVLGVAIRRARRSPEQPQESLS